MGAETNMTTELMLFLLGAIVLLCMIGNTPGGGNVTRGIDAPGRPK